MLNKFDEYRYAMRISSVALEPKLRKAEVRTLKNEALVSKQPEIVKYSGKRRLPWAIQEMKSSLLFYRSLGFKSLRKLLLNNMW